MYELNTTVLDTKIPHLGVSLNRYVSHFWIIISPFPYSAGWILNWIISAIFSLSCIYYCCSILQE